MCRSGPGRKGWGFYGGLLLAVAAALTGCSSHRASKAKPAASPEQSKRGAAVEPADNSYCYVCHVNYQEELLAQQHTAVGIGCEKCHGMSAKHSADEDNLTAPEKMYSEARLNAFCQECHPADQMAREPNHKTLLAANQAIRCTECHGEHRLKNRTRRWDKDTGKLVWRDGGPIMDRKN